MNIDHYQDAAITTAVYPGRATPLGLMYCALKLTGEAGEVSENVGKAIRDDGFGDQDLTEDREVKIIKELGDVLWYIAALADELGYPLSEVAQGNLDKLADRKVRGVLQGSGDDR